MPRNGLVDLIALAFFVALCLGIAALRRCWSWQPASTPCTPISPVVLHASDRVFGLIWTALYVLMAIAARRVAGRRSRHCARAADAVCPAACAHARLDRGGFRSAGPGAAVATIFVLDVGVAVTTLAFRPIDRWAGLLMLHSSPRGLRHRAHHCDLAPQSDS